MHDKEATDMAQLTYAVNTTVNHHAGFQGYAPVGVLTIQPKKGLKTRI
jgi:hypothetical protein